MPECPGKGVSGFPQSRGAFLGGAACEGPRALRREHEAGPIGSRPLSPSPLFVLGGSCSPAAFVSQGWDEPARGKGLSGPQPPAPPRSLVELNIFKHTHINKSSRWVCDSGPPRFCNQAQSGGHSKKEKKKKKINLLASPMPRRFGHFPVCSASPGTPGLPLSLGPPRFRPLVWEVGR